MSCLSARLRGFLKDKKLKPFDVSSGSTILGENADCELIRILVKRLTTGYRLQDGVKAIRIADLR